MKKIIPRKEINYTIYNEQDRNLIQINSNINIKNIKKSIENNKNEKNELLRKNYSHTKKNFPRIITQIDLKDFRNIRKKRKNFFKI